MMSKDTPAASCTFPEHCTPFHKHLLIVIFSSLLAAILAVSQDSLWIDEAFSAQKAMQPTFGDWWKVMQVVKGSDLQMPLYMAYLWLEEKVFGHSEWALRGANIPWFILGQVALYLGLRPLARCRVAVPLVALMSPFLWTYLNEARPYIMQYAGACIVLGSLCQLHLKASEVRRVNARWLGWLGFGIFILCGSSALGIPWAGAAVLAAYCLDVHLSSIRWTGATIATVAATSIILILLAGYYYWTLKQGARGAFYADAGWKNIAFAFYELLGFLGLGPSRLEIRAHGLKILESAVPLLVVSGPVIAGMSFLAFRRFAKVTQPRERLAVLLYVAFPLACVIALGFATGLRVLGRHLTPLVPVVTGLFAMAIIHLWQSGARLRQVAASLFIIVWLGSSLSLRFSKRHARDDYRSAAAMARDLLDRGGAVWWVAASPPAEYYQLPVTENPSDKGKALLLLNSDESKLQGLILPQNIFLSKGDLFDSKGAVAKFIEKHSYSKVRSLPAFTVWQQVQNPI